MPGTSIVTILSACFKAISTDSVNLLLMSGLITSLSTIKSILCFFFLSILISSDSSIFSPSILALINPSFNKSWINFVYSPFLPRIIGAITWILVPSSNYIILSIIWSIVCFSIFLPQIGQYGTPILAYNKRI